MPLLGDYVYDNGLNALDTTATHLEICGSDPTTYSIAATVSGVTQNLGTKNFGAGNVVNAPGAGSPNGRQVSTVAVTDGAVGTTGTATHWAITDRTNSRLLASGTLAASQAVTATNTFTLGSFTIRIPAAT